MTDGAKEHEEYADKYLNDWSSKDEANLKAIANATLAVALEIRNLTNVVDAMRLSTREGFMNISAKIDQLRGAINQIPGPRTF